MNTSLNHLARTDTFRRERAVDSPAALPLPGGVADLSAREIRFRDGKTSRLTRMEAELFWFLLCHAVKPVSRDDLLRDVWRLDPARVCTRTVDVHIGKLRRKLRDPAKSPKIILSIRGDGYMLRL